MSLKIIFSFNYKYIQDGQHSLRLKLAYDIKVYFEKKKLTQSLWRKKTGF